MLLRPLRPFCLLLGALGALALVGGGSSSVSLAATSRTKTAGQAVRETVLYSFPGNPGAWKPSAGLVFDGSGALYGTTVIGGGCNRFYYGCGTVFKLAPSGTGYVTSILYRFQGIPDGLAPSAPLAIDARGRLFGTTYSGGNAYGMGSVFELTPSGSGYSERIIHRFSGLPADGSTPFGGVAVAKGGNVYGTTSAGGTFGGGVLYRLIRNHDTYTETILLNFGRSSGSNSQSTVTLGASGAIYATTGSTVVKLSPSRSGYRASTLYHLNPHTEGFDLTGTLSIGPNGVLYGTAQRGGPGKCGTVFALTPSGSKYAFSMLHAFRCYVDFSSGGFPQAGVIVDADRSLYGTTYNGGLQECSLGGCGIVFKLTPSGHRYVETILWSFHAQNDGNEPFGGLIADAHGELYGTTGFGGQAGLRNSAPTAIYGTVFKIVP